MEIRTVAGTVLIQLHEELGHMVESGKYVRDLKTLIATKIGHSRFRLRLLSEEINELQDDMPVRPLPSLQLVILGYCVPEDPDYQELHRACENNQVVEVERLLQKPLNPNGTGAAIDHPPMLLAAGRGHLEVVRLFLEAGAGQNAATQAKTTALIFAAQNGHSEVVQVLLEARADQNAAGENGDTALGVAAEDGHSEVVRLLLKARADQNAARQDWVTALMVAADGGHLEVARLLLEAGADQNAVDQDGVTALIIAAENGHLEVVRLLLEAGAGPFRTDRLRSETRPDRSRSRSR
ncbi:Kinase D-interacting substrate of 220 kDa B (Ankyrin repeat-rich membrane-spanning protein B) [Durusdinium trenchii]|uniref:Kinase D-interacting substrate of 220 kDa B (Ankyrin repeat-rich membrane-spanning protein B) n=1 Tax=Durusdinium trenchii TaxID=1381693 RepID=A0ABP0MVZ7_9DINO